MNFLEKIIQKIQSGTACIFIHSEEMLRLDLILGDVAEKLKFNISEWNLEKGWVSFDLKRPQDTYSDVSQDYQYRLLRDLKNTPKLENRIIVLKNIDLVVEQTGATATAILNLIYQIQKHFAGQTCLVLTSSSSIVNQTLKPEVSFLDLPTMARDELAIYIDELLKKKNVSVIKEDRRYLLDASLGLTQQQVMQIVSQYCVDKNIEYLLAEKKQLIQKQGLLELVETSLSLSQIGGLENLKIWLDVKCKIFKRLDEAQKKHIPIPKGVLIAGMPGCGKSMTAKATAKMFDMPLLRLDLGRLLGKYVGESEANLRQALQLAERVSPCVLWLDELEKAFSGIKGGDSGSEVTARMFGYFLTWLQEKKSAVFVVATANNISVLPPELLRKGRFDEIFAVDFPESYERKNILEILFKKYQVTGKIDVDILVKKTENFAGSDLQAMMNEALEQSFITGQEITQNMFESIILNTHPLSAVLGDTITEYREKFKKFKLKTASLTEKDHQKLEQDYHILTIEQKRNLSIQFQIADPMMQKLAQEKDTTIIEQLLKHDNCPEYLINQIIQQKIDRVHNLGSSWSTVDLVLDESSFKAVCKHPKAKADLLIQLYRLKRLDPKEMLKILATRSDQQNFKSIVETKTAKLPSLSPNYVVSEILIEEKECVYSPKDILVVENNAGAQAFNLSKHIPAVITNICVSKKENISAGAPLFEYLYLV